MMRFILYILLLFCVSGTLYSQYRIDANIENKFGYIDSYALNGNGKITFENKMLNITDAYSNLYNIEFTSVRRITATKVILGIEKSESLGDNVAYSISPNPASDFIYITGDVYGKDICIFSVSGIPVIRQTLSSNRIDISGITKGIYVIYIENTYLKFVKR